MSNKGKRFVTTRRAFYGFTLHPNTAVEIANLAFSERITKSELVERAVNEYYKYHGTIYKKYKEGFYDNKTGLTPEEGDVLSELVAREEANSTENE